MSDRPTTQPSRAPRRAATAVGLLLAGAAALVTAVLLGLWVTDHLASTRLWRVEAVVAPLVVAIGVLAAGWVGASALVAGTCAAVRSAGGAWRSGEVAVHRWAPGLVRRALAVTVAAGVGLGAAAGAHATVETLPAPAGITMDLGWTPTTGVPTGHTTDEGTTPAAVSSLSSSPTELPPLPGVGAENDRTTSPTAELPDPTPPMPASVVEAAVAADAVSAPPPDVSTALPVASQVTAAPDTAPSAPPPALAGTIEVQRGDTLWALAARALGPDSSDAAIAAEWPRWYAANAATIGPDPDVLQPGQVLVVPTTDDGAAR